MLYFLLAINKLNIVRHLRTLKQTGNAFLYNDATACKHRYIDAISTNCIQFYIIFAVLYAENFLGVKFRSQQTNSVLL